MRKINHHRGTTPPLFGTETIDCLDNGDDVEEIAIQDQMATFWILIANNGNAAGYENGEL
jgi:hypothetical protein